MPEALTVGLPTDVAVIVVLDVAELLQILFGQAFDQALGQDGRRADDRSDHHNGVRAVKLRIGRPKFKDDLTAVRNVKKRIGEVLSHRWDIVLGGRYSTPMEH